MKRDGASTSAWQPTQYEIQSNLFSPDTVYDVIIIGAGITGGTAALLLQKAGKNCLLVDAANAGFGTTGGTTAHLNTFYDTPYYQMINDFGEENAKLMAQGASSAIGLIRTNITTHAIDCDFEERDGYLFSRDADQDKELEKVVHSIKQVGVSVDFIADNPFHIPCIRTAIVPQQAQFHPLRYLLGIIKAFQESGGHFIEHCRVTKLDEGNTIDVHTSLGIARAGQVIYATHIPPGVNILHLRCAPYRSYVVAAKLKNQDYPRALGYDLQEPYHYYRTHEIDGQNYLVVGGEDHKTGHEENTGACLARLEAHVRTYFDVEEVAYRWSSQFFEPSDGLPYIGRLPSGGGNVFVATGFGGNGMIYGTLAGLILSNMLVNGESIYQKLLDPNRVKPVAGFSNFVKENADVVKELVKGIFPADKLRALSEIAAGEARVVKYEGHVMGLYKDEQGGIHAVNTLCPHIKCTVAWNNAEKSWDCPCHGSRFSYDGELLTAPATSDLQKVDLSEKA
jgi:glycine/D-amino acid oxidase-like deaminating enzyme/nitrite reductase/ring-hydroxylating ferredoxin subunit